MIDIKFNKLNGFIANFHLFGAAQKHPTYSIVNTVTIKISNGSLKKEKKKN
jgi:hypothetical protein